MTSLTPLELAIMKSIWRRGQAQVKDVQLDLLPARDLAYTTVMTVLDRLFKKGIVGRAKRSRAHVYGPVCSEGEARADAVNGLLESFFDGSELRLLEYLGGGPEPSRPDAPRPQAVSSEVPIDDSLL